jgi:hypothetical protein
VTVPANDSNYKVKIAANFAESAASNTATEIEAIAINPTANFGFDTNPQNGVENDGYGKL